MNRRTIVFLLAGLESTAQADLHNWRIVQTTSVHLRKFNLIMLHCLKRGFPSYVDASRQKGTILNGDARDYDVSTQGTLAANIKVITCFAATNYLAEHYDLPRCDISRNSAVSPHRHTIVR
jgi:hypothetical protein